jgi:uncharacterized protein YcfJ
VFLFATISPGVAAPQVPSRLNDQQLKDLLSRIDTRTDTFRGSLERAIDHNQINGTQTEDRINQSVKDFEQANDRLRDRVNDGRSSFADVEEVLMRASVVDNFMTGHQLETAAQRDWQALRLDVDGLARAYGVAGNWSSSANGPARVNDQQVKQLLTRLRKEADQFRGNLDKALDRSRLHGSQEENSINQAATDFAKATNRLRSRFDSRQIVTSDVEDVLRRGGGIDRFMLTQRGQLAANAANDWVTVRRDLDGLASAYSVAWSWSEPGYTPGQSGASLSRRLTGTYQLDGNRGDDPRQAAEQAARAMPSDRRQPTYQRLMNRLNSPEAITIDRHGNNVTMASSHGPRVTFEADGRTRNEQGPGGRTIETSASLDGDRLVVTTNGNRGNDYTVTFEPMDNDRNLRVTRRIYDEALSQPVTVQSFYRRSSNEAQWDIYYPGRRDTSTNTNTANRDFAVPNGTRLVATLDQALSTETAREGDRVTMTTRSPSEYEGAVLEGIVSGVNASGRVSGRADLTLDFQSIRVRNGRTYPFGGVIENVRSPSGETIRVDSEGTVEDNDSQTGKTVQRSAIGAALGALIGAVAGGGQGAAIGAAIGAGGGAGTVIAQGRDQLDLQRGTEVTITSSAARGQGLTGGEPR